MAMLVDVAMWLVQVPCFMFGFSLFLFLFLFCVCLQYIYIYKNRKYNPIYQQREKKKSNTHTKNKEQSKFYGESINSFRSEKKKNKTIFHIVQLKFTHIHSLTHSLTEFAKLRIFFLSMKKLYYISKMFTFYYYYAQPCLIRKKQKINKFNWMWQFAFTNNERMASAYVFEEKAFSFIVLCISVQRRLNFSYDYKKK